jgi:hypothetical protein
MTRLRRGGLEPGVGLLALLIALIVLPPALPAATRVIAWGTNNFGQLDVPPGLTNVISIATAPYAAIALTAEGRLVPWGDNRNGRLNIPDGLPPVSAVMRMAMCSCRTQPFLVGARDKAPKFPSG